MKIKIILFALLLSSRIVFPQGYFFGAMVGGGWGHIQDNILFSGQQPEDYLHSFNFSLNVSHSVSYKSVIPVISYNAGLAYQSFSLTDTTTMSLIKLPIGLELQFGKKFQFLCGLGIFGEYYNHKNIYPDEVYTKFQFGLNADLGFNYRINEDCSIFIKLIKDYGMTTFEKEYLPNHFAPPSEENCFLNSTNINFGFNLLY